MAKKNVQTEFKSEVNMTPMIDIVFQLLLFFMVCSELSQLEAETVELPWAPMAKAPENQGKQPGLLIVNVMKSNKQSEAGEIRIGGRKYDNNTLKEVVRNRAAQEPLEDVKLRLSSLRVLIRADGGARFEAVQTVFDACQKNGVYKTEIAGSDKYMRPPQ